MFHFNHIVLTVLCSFLVLSCTTDDTSGVSGESTTVFSVTNEGGSFETDDGVTIDVPAGALAQAVELTVEESSSTPEGFEAASEVYEFGPRGLQFNEPVSISIPYESSGQGEVDFFWSRLRDDSSFDALPVATFADGVATASVTHFSFGFVGVRTRPIADAGTSPADSGPPNTDMGPVDAGSPDLPVGPDAGSPDTGPGPPDGGPLDAGPIDAGTPDTGTPDTGTPDTGTPDTGAPDAGVVDTGTPDAGTTDAGTGLQWYATCGDPVCSGWSDHGLRLCDTETLGEVCSPEGDQCDPKNGCNANYLCTDSDPTLGGCPISRAIYKRDIIYLDDARLQALHDEVLRIPLATYNYSAEPAEAPPRLGFIIEDVEPSPSVMSERDMVDLYGYTSMAVAAIQNQAREIEALRAEVEALRALLMECR